MARAKAPASRAASQDKQLHVVNGANHMSLYDVPQYADEAVSALAAFCQRTLWCLSRAQDLPVLQLYA